MIPGFHTVAFFMLWAAGISQSVLITQWPHYVSSLPSGVAEMHCYQNDTNYEYLYWYRQPSGGGFQLLLYLLAGSAIHEKGFETGFEAVKSNEKQWSLKITSVQKDDEAVYLCAASLHVFLHCDNTNEAYFGKGTKLTVLEPEHKPTGPRVKVLPPSAKKCLNQKDQNITIVCVARGFYPDHVGVSWKMDKENVTDGVATDAAAFRSPGGKYTITSRLRVSAEDWFTEGKEFTCTVSFFNGTGTEDYTNSTRGEKGRLISAEKYLRITQTAKLSYVVFIVKSGVYGAFVAFLVWKLQRSAGKQSD
ncbi:M1-specific T cell receptor beta chain-like [Clinocottus analis]|uniref:M1-specific T cell receptor beta chain-like n=1 Tax=Clinocottus analis TaxID=304258 RepID=UPI0035C22BE5